MALKPGCPRFIYDRVRVLPAIDLDDQAAFQADEIDNLGSDRNLPPEAMAGEFAIAEVMPELQLGIGHATTQRTGDLDRGC